MTADQIISVAGAAGTSAAGVIAAVVAALSPLIPILVPLLLAQVRDSRSRLALEAVTRAAIPAVSAASQTIYDAMDRARRSDSPGGKAITHDEKRAAIAVGVARGIAVLSSDLRTWRLVLQFYGAEGAVREAFEVLIRRKAMGHRLDEPADLGDYRPSPPTTNTTNPRTFGSAGG